MQMASKADGLRTCSDGHDGMQVQQEDIQLCERVQHGLACGAYHSGRCAQSCRLQWTCCEDRRCLQP